MIRSTTHNRSSADTVVLETISPDLVTRLRFYRDEDKEKLPQLQALLPGSSVRFGGPVFMSLPPFLIAVGADASWDGIFGTPRAALVVPVAVGSEAAAVVEGLLSQAL